MTICKRNPIYPVLQLHVKNTRNIFYKGVFGGGVGGEENPFTFTRISLICSCPHRPPLYTYSNTIKPHVHFHLPRHQKEQNRMREEGPLTPTSPPLKKYQLNTHRIFSPPSPSPLSEVGTREHFIKDTFIISLSQPARDAPQSATVVFLKICSHDVNEATTIELDHKRWVRDFR